MTAWIFALVVLLGVVAGLPQEYGLIESSKIRYYPVIGSLSVISFDGGKKNYTFIDEDMTFYDAVDLCRAHNMELVSIESELESINITNYLISKGWDNGIHFHTSCNTIGRATSWLWLNGENVLVNNWGPGQPNNPTTHHCMHIYKTKWNTGMCTFTGNAGGGTGAICETIP